MSRGQASSDAQQETKRVVRQAIHELRRVLPDQPARSVAVWLTVTGLSEVRAAKHVLAFESVTGEPDSGPFVAWCHEMGKRITVAASNQAAQLPTNPGDFDLVVVPGVAFTERGDRLGRGGGWYDRLIPALRPNCFTVGVAFDIQVLPELPVEPHDARVSVVVTETRALRHTSS